MSLLQRVTHYDVAYICAQPWEEVFQGVWWTVASWRLIFLKQFSCVYNKKAVVFAPHILGWGYSSKKRKLSSHKVSLKELPLRQFFSLFLFAWNSEIFNFGLAQNIYGVYILYRSTTLGSGALEEYTCRSGNAGEHWADVVRRSGERKQWVQHLVTWQRKSCTPRNQGSRQKNECGRHGAKM